MNKVWALRRLGEAVIAVWLLTIASFFIVALAPGDAVLSVLRIDDVAVSKSELEATRERMGLNDPLIVRYWHYLEGLLRGDMGTSVMTGKPVSYEISKALPASAILSGVSLLVTALVVVLLGWLAARYRNTWVDKIIMWFCYLGASIPAFWLGLLLITMFAVKVKLLPSSGWHNGAGLVLPVICLVVAIAPPFVKMFRNRYVEINAEDYVRAARMRGVPERNVVLRHVTRGSLIPVVTMLAVSLGSLLSGSVVIEVVFGLPGMGRLAVEAIARRDYAVIQGFVLVVGIAILVIMAFVDGLCRMIDPSIKIKEQERG